VPTLTLNDFSTKSGLVAFTSAKAENPSKSAATFTIALSPPAGSTALFTAPKGPLPAGAQQISSGSNSPLAVAPAKGSSGSSSTFDWPAVALPVGSAAMNQKLVTQKEVFQLWVFLAVTSNGKTEEGWYQCKIGSSTGTRANGGVGLETDDLEVIIIGSQN